jgi:hypothetical protein
MISLSAGAKNNSLKIGAQATLFAFETLDIRI